MVGLLGTKIHHCKSVCIREKVSFSQFPHKPMEKSGGCGLEVLTLLALFLGFSTMYYHDNNILFIYVFKKTFLQFD